MALVLPLNFKNDIQGSNTALIPIVKLSTGGGLYEQIILSTSGHHIVDYADEPFPVLPLLLNIPSLKESIDIEKRNYKISSVKIDINNFLYDGKRFSERVLGSLINIECRIFFTSPTAKRLSSFDQTSNHPDNSALEIFYGIVRKYKHDDNKAQLVIEDRSQAVLHRNLPLSENYLGAGVDVPDKYKNKPRPIVCGHVDKSPVVIQKAPAIEEWGIAAGNIEMIADSDDTSIVNNLSTFAEDYVTIPAVLDLVYGDDILDYPNGMEQWSSANNIITLAESAGWDDENSNPISRNKIICEQFLPMGGMSFKPLRSKSIYWSSTDGWNPGGSGSRSFYGSYLNKVGNNPLFYGTVLKEPDGEDDADASWNGESYLWGDPVIPTGEPSEAQMYLNIYGVDGGQGDKHEMKIVGGIIQTGVLDSADFDKTAGILQWRARVHPSNSQEWGGGGNRNIHVRVGGNQQDDYGAGGFDLFSINLESFGAESWFVTPHYETSETKHAIIENTKELLAYIKLTTEEGFPGAGAFAAKFELFLLNLYSYSLIKNMVGQNFYSDVMGRGGEYLNATEAINEILGELNIDPVFSNDYGSWKYAFTVNKKINSKKLIEGIASASPFIPHFNNMGKFKVDSIPIGDSELTDANGNELIKEIDVIDYAYSRTPIEDVYTKVEFKYKWDYEREEFGEELKIVYEDGAIRNYCTADEYFMFYENSYYGFNEDHSESTLVIDDDRGKYIRDGISANGGNTAEKFAAWILTWHCNQHLKIKVKLPLKYMNLEVGDKIAFDEIIGGVKPYGINYKDGASDSINGQIIFPTFMITSTNKTLEWVELECVQLHLLSQYVNSDDPNGGYEDCPEGYDECLICGGDNSSCADCAGIPNGSAIVGCDGICVDDPIDAAVIDCCGVCGGGAINCEEDCLGVCGGDADVDDCGVCGGDGSSCTDCNGVPNGSAFEDDCGDCVGGDTEEVACTADCWGTWDGDAVLGCDDVCDSGKEFDDCGICFQNKCKYGSLEGENCETDEDCPGICEGDNSTCTDCRGELNGHSFSNTCSDCVETLVGEDGELYDNYDWTECDDCNDAGFDCQSSFGDEGVFPYNCWNPVEGCGCGCGTDGKLDECGICYRPMYATQGGDDEIIGYEDCEGNAIQINQCRSLLLTEISWRYPGTDFEFTTGMVYEPVIPAGSEHTSNFENWFETIMNLPTDNVWLINNQNPPAAQTFWGSEHGLTIKFAPISYDSQYPSIRGYMLIYIDMHDLIDQINEREGTSYEYPTFDYPEDEENWEGNWLTSNQARWQPLLNDKGGLEKNRLYFEWSGSLAEGEEAEIHISSEEFLSWHIFKDGEISSNVWNEYASEGDENYTDFYAGRGMFEGAINGYNVKLKFRIDQIEAGEDNLRLSEYDNFESESGLVLTSGCPIYGDTNGDGVFNILDVVILVNCVLSANCPTEVFPGCNTGDINGDGGYNVLDLVLLMNCVLADNCNELAVNGGGG